LAQAVAEEMKKVYKSELGPQPIPLTIPGEAISEEDVSAFFGFWLLVLPFHFVGLDRKSCVDIVNAF